MKSRKLTFENKDGVQLVGRVDMPDDGEARAFALFAHCFTCSKNLNAVSNINRALTDQGFGVLRFDFTGLGESDGDFSDTNFSSNVADLVNAATYMAGELQAPQLLIGHSLGGAAVLQAAGEIPSVKAVVTIGAPADPAHVQHLFQDNREEIDRCGQAVVQLAGRDFTIKKQFIDDLDQQNLADRIKNLKRALLVCHGVFDQTVGIENASAIFGHAKHPKSFLSLDDADHLLTQTAHSRYAGGVIAAWASKYLG